MTEKKLSKTDYFLWILTGIYICLIYATLSIVSSLRKTITERYGYEVLDNINWLFIIAGAGIAINIFARKKGSELVHALSVFILTGLIYSYYIFSIGSAVERIHFIEYGLLGALIYAAFIRHFSYYNSISASIMFVYIIGMGDESIQWILPDRVGEIKDCILNLISGILGIAVFIFSTGPERRFSRTTRFQQNFLFTASFILVVLNLLFIYHVHGFGHIIENKEPGRFYSCFQAGKLNKINADCSAGLSRKEKEIYNNEAMRHLHQREFYFTNDFLITGGGFYRQYDKSLFENKILEYYYSRFLSENSDEPAGKLVRKTGKETAEKSMERNVLWPDSLKQWVEKRVKPRNIIYESRVKSTVITSFSLNDLLFHSGLILLVLFYLWRKVRKEKTAARK